MHGVPLIRTSRPKKWRLISGKESKPFLPFVSIPKQLVINRGKSCGFSFSKEMVDVVIRLLEELEKKAEASAC